MRKIQIIIIIIIASLILSSCAKLPLHQSKKVEGKKINSNLRYYSGNVRYDIYNNDREIHIYIATSDYTTQLKILKLGFTLWLDQKGRKTKTKGIAFPQKQTLARNSFKREVEKSRGYGDFKSQDREERQMAQLHKQFNKSTKYMTLIGIHGENSRNVVNTELEKSVIQVSITFDSLSILHYVAIIPIDKIFTEEKYNDNTFSIGFESGIIEMPTPTGAMQGKAGMQGKGMSNGGERMPGGIPSKSRGGIEQYSALLEPIKTWFKVTLNPIDE